MIVPIKCMPKISAVGLFCLDKFENNQTRTCTTFFRTSKLTEVYFKVITDRDLFYTTDHDLSCLIIEVARKRKKK